ncbi:MAG: potassium-transporting ATPase subunit F [Dehalococcoidia bacterium]
MTEVAVTAVLAVAAFAYVLYALLFPERF